MRPIFVMLLAPSPSAHWASLKLLPSEFSNENPRLTIPRGDRR